MTGEGVEKKKKPFVASSTTGTYGYVGAYESNPNPNPWGSGRYAATPQTTPGWSSYSAGGGGGGGGGGAYPTQQAPQQQQQQQQQQQPAAVQAQQSYASAYTDQANAALPPGLGPPPTDPQQLLWYNYYAYQHQQQLLEQEEAQRQREQQQQSQAQEQQAHSQQQQAEPSLSAQHQQEQQQAQQQAQQQQQQQQQPEQQQDQTLARKIAFHNKHLSSATSPFVYKKVHQQQTQQQLHQQSPTHAVAGYSGDGQDPSHAVVANDAQALPGEENGVNQIGETAAADRAGEQVAHTVDVNAQQGAPTATQAPSPYDSYYAHHHGWGPYAPPGMPPGAPYGYHPGYMGGGYDSTYGGGWGHPGYGPPGYAGYGMYPGYGPPEAAVGGPDASGAASQMQYGMNGGYPSPWRGYGPPAGAPPQPMGSQQQPMPSAGGYPPGPESHMPPVVGQAQAGPVGGGPAPLPTPAQMVATQTSVPAAAATPPTALAGSASPSNVAPESPTRAPAAAVPLQAGPPQGVTYASVVQGSGPGLAQTGGTSTRHAAQPLSHSPWTSGGGTAYGQSSVQQVQPAPAASIRASGSHSRWDVPYSTSAQSYGQQQTQPPYAAVPSHQPQSQPQSQQQHPHQPPGYGWDAHQQQRQQTPPPQYTQPSAVPSKQLQHHHQQQQQQQQLQQDDMYQIPSAVQHHQPPAQHPQQQPPSLQQPQQLQQQQHKQRQPSPQRVSHPPLPSQPGMSWRSGAPPFQIPTNPRIAPAIGGKGMPVSGAAGSGGGGGPVARPAYVSVADGGPSTATPPTVSSVTNNSSADEVLKPGMFPPSLLAYVERALNRCKDDGQKAACQDVMKEMIMSASSNGTLFTRDWDTEPLPHPVAASMAPKMFRGSKGDVPPGPRLKSRWEPLREEGRMPEKDRDRDRDRERDRGRDRERDHERDRDRDRDRERERDRDREAEQDGSGSPTCFRMKRPEFGWGKRGRFQNQQAYQHNQQQHQSHQQHHPPQHAVPISQLPTPNTPPQYQQQPPQQQPNQPQPPQPQPPPPPMQQQQYQQPMHPKNKRYRPMSVVNGEGGSGSDSDKEGDADKDRIGGVVRMGAVVGVESMEERQRRQKRSKRFDFVGAAAGRGAGRGPNRMGVGGSASARRHTAMQLAMSASDGVGNGGAVEDIDWDALTVKGTCQEIEKSYLRLTSAPDPGTVRPEEILKKALVMVQHTNRNYFYVCEQLKSIRQDLTVQRIRNEFTVEVYETHARVALEAGDLAEYNQCQTQLKTLYKEGMMGRRNEFAAYGLLYTVFCQRNKQDLRWAMARLTTEEKADPAVQHAQTVRAAFTSENFWAFFRLYRTAPNLNQRFMDIAAEKVRFSAIQSMTRAYRPTVPVSHIARALGFTMLVGGAAAEDEMREDGAFMEADGVLEVEDIEGCEDWLRAHGAVLIPDATDSCGEMMLDTKASANVLFMPEDVDAVSHGDATLAVEDFLARN